MLTRLCFGWISLCQSPSDMWVGLWALRPRLQGRGLSPTRAKEGGGEASEDRGKKAYHLLVTDAGLQLPLAPLPTPAAHSCQEVRQPWVNRLPGPPAWPHAPCSQLDSATWASPCPEGLGIH